VRPDSPPISELSKRFYVIQIQDLESKILRYQEKCDKLQLSATEHEDKYIQIGKDKKEIVSFLKKTLEQRQDEISDLQERLTALQQAKDHEKEAFDNQMTQIKREFQEVRDRLTSENMILGGKLSALEEFKVQREILMKKFETLEEEFKQKEAAHQEQMYNLGRKAVVDKDRLKKEMILRVNEVAAEFRKVSNKQMAETTKRNIRENLSMNVQLGKMSEKTRDLIEENDALKATEKELRVQIKLLESCQTEIAKKNNGNLKVLKMIASKAREQEMVLDEMETREQEFVAIEDESNFLKSEYEQLQAQFKENEQELASTKDLLETAKQERDEAITSKERFEDILAATAYTLREVINEDVDKQEDVLANRGTMVERLLLVLDNAGIIGKGPTPSDFLNQRSKALMAALTTKKESGTTADNEVAAAAKKKLAHYQLGDLGLVPRPALDKSAHAKASNVAHLSETTRLGGVKKIRIRQLATTPLKHHGILPPIPSDGV